MEPLLLLLHRIPAPDTRGDVVRSYHLLMYLAARYRVHLGVFIDDRADLERVPRLKQYCASVQLVTMRRSMARMRSLFALLSGQSMTLRYYHDDDLASWVRTIVGEEQIRKVVVFSSAMAQYVFAHRDLRVVVDFVELDSAKWLQDAQSRSWPFSAIYRREGARLFAFERAVGRSADASVFVTPTEASLFRSLAPECMFRIHHAQNGIDSEYFSPLQELTDPYAPGEEAAILTGAMDDETNVEGACWFVKEVMPTIVAERPSTRFYVVGDQPGAGVAALAREGQVVVIDQVMDVRPYLKHARLVVAPQRVAYGIQDSVLEAMAMGRPVVASAAVAQELSAIPALDFEVGSSAAEFASKALDLMDTERGRTVGRAARERILADYHWMTNLAPFDELLCAADVLRAGLQ